LGRFLEKGKGKNYLGKKKTDLSTVKFKKGRSPIACAKKIFCKEGGQKREGSSYSTRTGWGRALGSLRRGGARRCKRRIRREKIVE